MNNQKLLALLVPIVFLLVIGVSSSTYVILEGRQAVITQFGRPIGMPVTKPGLHFKKPFIQKIHIIEMRILNWDGYPNQIPTKDKKYIHADTTARWRIKDALKFIQTVQTERGARARLDGILDAVTRDIIADHNLVETVRNTNKILERKVEVAGDEDRVTGVIPAIVVGREKLSTMILEGARKELAEFGIELIDVLLRRIAYEESVEKKVYDRMISERMRMSQKIRSKGRGDEARIKGKTNRDLLRIQSASYRKAQNIKGKAEAESIKIYADTLSKDPSYYEFIRTLDAYEKAIPEGTKLILSTDSKFFDLLRKGK